MYQRQVAVPQQVSRHRSIFLANVLQAALLSLFLLWLPIVALSSQHESLLDFPYMGSRLTIAAETGVLWISDITYILVLFYACIALPVGVGVLGFALSAYLEYRKRPTEGKKPSLMWSSILLALNTVLIVSILVTNFSSVRVRTNDELCGVPIRPAITVPNSADFPTSPPAPCWPQ